jgi:hypothetical protein
MKAETIAKALGGRKSGGGWMARCPAHDDREPSLSIRDESDGRVLVRCHGTARVEAYASKWSTKRLRDRVHDQRRWRRRRHYICEDQAHGSSAVQTICYTYGAS